MGELGLGFLTHLSSLVAVFPRGLLHSKHANGAGGVALVPRGGVRRGWQDHHPVQAQAGRGSPHPPDHWYVGRAARGVCGCCWTAGFGGGSTASAWGQAASASEKWAGGLGSLTAACGEVFACALALPFVASFCCGVCACCAVPQASTWRPWSIRTSRARCGTWGVRMLYVASAASGRRWGGGAGVRAPAVRLAGPGRFPLLPCAALAAALGPRDGGSSPTLTNFCCCVLLLGVLAVVLSLLMGTFSHAMGGWRARASLSVPLFLADPTAVAPLL